MSLVIAAIGAKALYLLYGWLASAIIANYLSERKGYGAKLGLALGLLLSVIGVIILLVIPARRDSRWKLQGPFGKGGGKTVAEARAEREVEES
jgi:fucose permease